MKERKIEYENFEKHFENYVCVKMI